MVRKIGDHGRRIMAGQEADYGGDVGIVADDGR